MHDCWNLLVNFTQLPMIFAVYIYWTKVLDKVFSSEKNHSVIAPLDASVYSGSDWVWYSDSPWFSQIRTILSSPVRLVTKIIMNQTSGDGLINLLLPGDGSLDTTNEFRHPDNVRMLEYR